MQLLRNWINHSPENNNIYGIWCNFKNRDIGGKLNKPRVMLSEDSSDIYTFTSNEPEDNMTSYRRFSEKFPEQINAFKANLK